MGSSSLQAALLFLATLVAELDGAQAKQKKPWTGPDGDNPKPFVLRYQKYIGPFMAM